MKYAILKRNEDGSLGPKLGSYESDSKDDSSKNRSYLHAEPQACHMELPEGMDEDCVEVVEVAEEIIPASGIEGEEGYVAEQVIPAHIELQENSDLVLAKRNTTAQTNLDAIRSLRQPLLDEADHEINTMEDDSVDATAMRAYRKALRECTDSLKKINGMAKLSCESLVPSEFTFPTKPQ